MSSGTYPYWLLSLIGTQETAVNYAGLVGNSKTMFYTFPDSVPIYSAATDMANGFASFNKTQQQNAVTALECIQSVTSLSFVQSDVALASNTILFALNVQTKDSYAYAYLPEIHPMGSDIYMAIHPTNETMSVGTQGALTLIHEIGHALGLKHPHEEVEGLGSISVLPSAEDLIKNTVMSYAESSVDSFKFELGLLDIAALQYIYGPNLNARASDDTYVISSTRSNFIWDGAGVDTIDASQLTAGVTIHLDPGYHDFVGERPAPIVTAPGQITVNFGTTIENLIGTQFNDALYGNAQQNLIAGNGGSDTIFGGGGIDTVLYPEPLLSTTLRNNKKGSELSWVIALPNGIKSTLTNVERLIFTDSKIALDLSGHAGDIAKLLGAFLGSDGAAEKSLVGAGLRYLDAGGSYDELTQLAITHVFGEIPNSQTVVSTFYENLTGQQAPADLIAEYVSSLDNGELTVRTLAQQVAENELNLSNIDFVGLSASGIEYY